MKKLIAIIDETGTSNRPSESPDSDFAIAALVLPLADLEAFAVPLETTERYRLHCLLPMKMHYSPNCLTYPEVYTAKEFGDRQAHPYNQISSNSSGNCLWRLMN
jgi:hypothetical protein